MANLFSRIKSKLSQDFGGRYLGVVLEQVIADCPKFSQVIFPKLGDEIVEKLQNGQATVSAERSFRVKMKNKRADLAICDGQKIVALAEIKYEDHKAPGNFGQIGDYLDWQKRNDGVFTYLTQYTPPLDDMERIEKAARSLDGLIAHRFFRDLYRHGKRDYQNSYTVRLLCEFLKEEHVVYSEDFGAGAKAGLKFLLVDSLSAPRTKFGKIGTVPNALRGTKLFADLFANALALSDWFQGHGRLETHFGNRFAPHIGFIPEFNSSKVKKRLGSDKEGGKEKKVYFDGHGAVTGGWLYILMHGKHKRSLAYINMGYCFELNVNAKPPLLKGYIGSFVDGGGVEYSEDWKSFKLSDSLKLSEPSAHKLVLGTMTGAITKSLKSPNLKLNARKSLKALCDDMRHMPEY